ncbi:MAG: hypothetical protein KAU16_08375 [Methanophagales archaeon]|nr:hypothetical protein [Methanophagales archaeon]
MELYEIMIANLTYIVGGVVIAVVAFLIKRILTKGSERRERKKRRKMWIKLLRSNKFVNECISRFEKIGSSEEGRTILLKFISGFLGGFTPIGLFLLLNGYLGDIWLSMAYSTLIIFFPVYLLIILIGRYIVKSGRRSSRNFPTSILQRRQQSLQGEYVMYSMRI